MANTLGWLGVNRLWQKQYEAAEPFIREALEIFDKVSPENYRRFYWASVLGEALWGQQRVVEAEPLLLGGYAGMKQQEAVLGAEERPRLAEAGRRIVRFYEVTGQLDKAHIWRERLSDK
jgi:hypothetical protein